MTDLDVPGTPILVGVAGSTAFGLNHENSDIDLHGVYVAPTREVLGLRTAKAVTNTYTHSDPDIAIHEVGKFISLGLKCNPTILETLWLDDYSVYTHFGAQLVGNRNEFLSTKYVRDAYKGYALSCLSKKENSFKTEKAARHGIRILRNGYELLTTGDMRINRSFEREELFALGELALELPNEFRAVFEGELDKLLEASSILPDYPSADELEDLLVRIRLAYI